MAISNFTRVYLREEFTSLVGNIPIDLLAAALTSLSLTIPIVDVRLSPQGDAVIVQWNDFPSSQDVADVDAAVAAFAGGTTTSQPFEFNSFEVSTTQSGTHVAKIDETTPPLEPGTYQVLWSSSLRMQAVIANTGVEGRIVLTRSDGVSVTQSDSWDLANVHAFNGGITFVVQAGQTLHVELTFARLGASGTAEMSGARVTVDQLSAATA